jgi:GNAT superfamily N-acetyltransferase
MEFRRISSPDSAAFREIWKIYEYSFPPDERRGLRRQREAFRKKPYRFFSVHDRPGIIGLITAWHFPDFVFLEHLAVKKNLRGKKYGTRILGRYVRRLRKTVVLEVERPGGSPFAEKRITFYRRAGFVLNSYDYIQPPYGRNKKPVPLFLMTYGRKRGKKELSKIIRTLYAVVYDFPGAGIPAC